MQYPRYNPRGNHEDFLLPSHLLCHLLNHLGNRLGDHQDNPRDNPYEDLPPSLACNHPRLLLMHLLRPDPRGLAKRIRLHLGHRALAQRANHSLDRQASLVYYLHPVQI